MATKAKHNRTMTQQEMDAAMKVAQRVAKRYGAALFDDVLGAAYEGMMLAWNNFDPQRGLPFATCCVPFIKEYARREANRLSSVVTTNYVRNRSIAKDEGMEIGTGDDAYERVVEDDTLGIEERVAAAQELQQTYHRMMARAAGLSETQQRIAEDICRERLLDNNGTTLGEIAVRHGVSRQLVNKVAKDITADA